VQSTQKKKISLLLLLLLASLHSYAQQTLRQYLSGTGNDHTVNWEFFCTGGMNANKWTTIAVPSCWELQGFGKYDYGFAKDSVRGKEKGLYKYNFTVPAGWQNKKINIVFEGVMTDAEVKINGQPAGDIHQGAFYAFRYDITQLLKYEQTNLLEVTVAKHSANASVNEAERKADFWIFGGIFRPVYLEVLPKTYIDLQGIDARADGSLAAGMLIHSDDARDRSYEIETSITDLATNKLINRFLVKSGPVVSVNKKITGIKTWSPESPSLYKIIFTLRSNGQVLHTVEKRIGFRTVEVKQRDGIYVNGVKVKMKGVNRHSFWPTSGRTTSKKISIDDILLMKDMNMNAVRMSHYPPDDHFLDVCDSLGLFVMDELAGWHGHYDTPTGTRLLREMIAHDTYHPSIILWANGNEGGHNFDLDPFFSKFDIQQRPVVHPWQLFGGIETQHYREYNYGIGNYENGNEIVMPTEFLHGQFDGGHGAGLEDYWEKMWHNPLSAGGFLWDFADQGVVRKDLDDSIDTDKHRGADGIVGPYHQKEGSYFAIKEIWSPVFFERREITPQFDGVINLENRYHFTNLDQCVFTYTLRSFSHTLYNIPDKTGMISSPGIRPGARGSIRLVLPKDWQQFDVLLVTVKDKKGDTVITKSYRLQSPATVADALALGGGPEQPAYTETDSLFIVKANGVTVQIHRRTGLLADIKNQKGQRIPFGNGPVIEEGNNNFGSFTASREGDKLIIRSSFDKKAHYNTLEWIIYPSGIIRMTVNYFPAAYFTSLAGVNFSYPEQRIKNITYEGDGPYRVWKNRMKGNQFGVWTKEYNTTETGEAPWRYPEFKGYHSNMYWCTIRGDDHAFMITTPDEGLFLRLFTPAWKTDQWHNYEPIFPSGDISFMQGISSIGTKTQRNETTGPMGQKNIFYDYEKDPSRALKIVLYFNFR